jgi:ribosomal protein L11 methyltransferase
VNRDPWQVVEVTCLREAGEAIEFGLMEAGALGTETRETSEDHPHVVGYYDSPVDEAEIRSALLDALRIYDLAPSSLIDLTVTELEDRDWLAEWKKEWRPAEVGRFIVAPPWSEHPFSRDRIVIRIEPGMAFGTGTHETTRLCLKMIEKYFRDGSFLDVGTGTGILAIAAAKMFSGARVEAVDTDADAVEIARENARLNEVGDQIDFRIGAIAEETASANMVCANLTAPVIVELLPLLLGATCGRLVLSGILDTQVRMVEAKLRELGAVILESEQDGEWYALVV